MNEPDLSFIRSDIDLSEVAPLNWSRVVAYVNCFLYKMTDLLSSFADEAERSLLEAERQLRAADVKLQLLETKLASIPDPAPDFTTSLPEASCSNNGPSETTSQTTAETTASSNLQANEPKSSDGSEVKEADPNAVTVKDDPAFAKYFKMLKVGVSEQAVRQKMQSEGVDPSLLDCPDAASPYSNKSCPER